MFKRFLEKGIALPLWSKKLIGQHSKIYYRASIDLTATLEMSLFCGHKTLLMCGRGLRTFSS